MRTKRLLFVLLSALCLVTVWAQPFDADIRQTADYKQGQTWVPVLLRDNSAATRANLGFSTNLNTLWTSTNASNARGAIGLGSADSVEFNEIGLTQVANGTRPKIVSFDNQDGTESIVIRASDSTDLAYFSDAGSISLQAQTSFNLAPTFGQAAATRTNLGLGGGITTNLTFVANGVTNSVTISNGIIKGWTQ